MKKNPFFNLIFSIRIPKTPLIIGMVGTILTTFVGLSIPLLTREVVDGFNPNNINIGLIIGIIAVFLIQAVVDGLSTYSLAYVGQTIVQRLRETMWVKFLHLPVRYYDKNKSGESVSRIVNDTSIVKDLITQHFPQFINGIITIIGAVIILLIMDWKMTLLMLIAVPFVVAVLMPLGKKMSTVSRGLQDETANFSGAVQQTLGEIRLMKASHAENHERSKGFNNIKELFLFGLREAKIFAMIGPLMYLVNMLVVVVIFGYGGIRVADGSMSTGSLIAFLLYLVQITFPITSFAMFFTQLQKAKGATERIIDILDLDEEPFAGRELDISNKALHFQNVSFQYNDEEKVIEDMSFTVPPGKMIAFCGPSGGGKTTVFGLIEQYYEPTSGNISIGDIPITDLAKSSWRTQLGYVSQDSPMMAGTIRDNLTYGLENPESITDDELWEVAKMAYADQFIKEFPEQLDTEVGERGVKLSGGQRQRIAIARAFLRNPKILMMDEATASLDSQSEAIVQQALSRLMEGRTTLVIAHRLSTIVDADKIIFIEKGRITGTGTHQELIASHDLYREFAEQQLT
ncbi:ATP-binding cassette subfamily B protein AbcA/BmrA [Gracilibacillus halotolerans]|uniref:ATP-binding cassette subfamily B protein AbcA/BmrA n=1 Tax=Gracilibacillus halotolerans TaxID=74386 RepID=A0A841RRJ8_9BACI|nr:ABC transporter ATP-binding protein [Gracilibacillus halotolerans]MBB6513564.1 ATP-binding cassette subfamily B protein AbcA/BmrA [Gracilibacillus halotolerans]